MRRFRLRRIVDKSGISGTGIVAEGIKFSDGTVAMRWRTKHASTVFWPSMQEVREVHCHEGNSAVEWLDPETDTDVLVIEVTRGMTHSLPSHPYCLVTYEQNGIKYGLSWHDAWGDPPKPYDRIKIEFDAMMSPKHARIVRAKVCDQCGKRLANYLKGNMMINGKPTPVVTSVGISTDEFCACPSSYLSGHTNTKNT